MSLWYSEAARNFVVWSPGVSGQWGQGDKVPNAQGPQLWGGGAWSLSLVWYVCINVMYKFGVEQS